MKLINFAAGFAVGYVLGARAGKGAYEQIAAAVGNALNPGGRSAPVPATNIEIPKAADES